jgi:hypothetical protein
MVSITTLRGRHGRDHMVSITTYAISAYHH